MRSPVTARTQGGPGDGSNPYAQRRVASGVPGPSNCEERRVNGAAPQPTDDYILTELAERKPATHTEFGTVEEAINAARTAIADATRLPIHHKVAYQGHKGASPSVAPL